jgi:hypothetical protein
MVTSHTISYVSIRCRISYDVVRQHTISYVSIRCRTSTYDVVYDMAMHWRQHGRCGGGGDLTKQIVQAFLARKLEASEARSSVILDVFEGLKQNEVTWTDSTRDQHAVRSARPPPTPPTPPRTRMHAYTRAHARARMHAAHAARACTPRTPRAHARRARRAACVHVARWLRAQGKGAYM